MKMTHTCSSLVVVICFRDHVLCTRRTGFACMACKSLYICNMFRVCKWHMYNYMTNYLQFIEENPKKEGYAVTNVVKTFT